MKDRRQEIETIMKIIDRANDLGIIADDMDNLTLLMDIEAANKKFNLDLNSWLNTPDMGDFMHDFEGIENNIDRTLGFENTQFNDFIPRFLNDVEILNIEYDNRQNETLLKDMKDDMPYLVKNIVSQETGYNTSFILSDYMLYKREGNYLISVPITILNEKINEHGSLKIEYSENTWSHMDSKSKPFQITEINDLNKDKSLLDIDVENLQRYDDFCFMNISQHYGYDVCRSDLSIHDFLNKSFMDYFTMQAMNEETLEEQEDEEDMEME